MLRNFQLYALQNHFVATDHGRTKVPTGTTNQSIGQRRGFGLTGRTTYNNVGFVNYELGVDSDGFG